LIDKVNDRVNPNEGEGIEEKTTDKEDDLAVSLHQIAYPSEFVHRNECPAPPGKLTVILRQFSIYQRTTTEF
jgi:hypothetical protein